MSTEVGKLHYTLDLDDDKFKTGLAKSGGMMQSFGSTIGHIAGVAFTALKAGALAAGTALVGLGTFGISTASDLQRTSISMQALAKSTELGNKAFSELYQYALKSPFAFPDVAAAGKTLMAFGVSANDVTRQIELLGNVSIVSGTDLGHLAGIFGRVSAQGRAMGGDIQQLTENGVAILPALQAQLGKTADEVREMARNGEIDFEVFRKALESTVDPSVLEKLTNTLPRQLDRLKGSLRSVALAFVGVNIADGFAMEANGLQQAAINVTKHLADILRSPGITKAVSVLGTQVAGLVDSLAPLIDAMLPVVMSIAGVLVQAFTALTPAITALLTGAAPGLTAFFDALGQAMQTMAPSLQLIGKTLGEALAKVLIALAPALPALADAFVMLAPPLAKVIELFATFLAQILEWLIPYIPQLMTWLQGLFNWVQGIVNDPNVQMFFKVIWGQLAMMFNEVVKVIRDWLWPALQELWKAIEPYAPYIGGALLAVLGALVMSFLIAVGVITAVITAITKLITWIIQLHTWFSNLSVNVNRAIVDTLRNVANAIAGFIGNMYNAGRDMINGLVNGLRDNAGRVIEVVKNVVSGSLDAIKKFFKIGSPSKVMAEQGGFIMAGLVQGIMGGSRDVMNASASAANGIMSGFGSPALNTSLGSSIEGNGSLAGGKNVYNINMSGVMTRSRSDERAVAQSLIESINEEKRAKGQAEL